MNPTGSSSFSHDELLEIVPALRRFARRFLTRSEDIEDLVQDTVMRALANADKYQSGTRLKSWMFTIMRNHFCTKFGVSKREVVGLSDDICSRVVAPATQEWTLRGRELELAISSLPEHHLSAMSMIFIEGISYEEASHRSNCPVGTMKSRVNRARQQLVKSLGDID
jgi:RNA polymerase sigma factor (sigma-70 family)